jgi:hypothetical protein
MTRHWHGIPRLLPHFVRFPRLSLSNQQAASFKSWTLYAVVCLMKCPLLPLDLVPEYRVYSDDGSEDGD